MRVLFVSQCSKNALDESRRIIDQFAERKGDAVWETLITQQGLETVKKLLKATARRNTAVACHLFRGQLQTELLWIVGNHRKFNHQGIIPTNVTGRDILRADDENGWNTGEAIALIAAMAGLFHDFGKANSMFQNKLKRKSGKSYEPFRHEWISLLLFKRFVGSSTDKEWLERLSTVSEINEHELICDFPDSMEELIKNPLKGLPDLAKFIGWLILSHHRLPVSREEDAPRLDNINEWMEGKRFSGFWNSPQCDNDDWVTQDYKAVGLFPVGTPFMSKTWCKRVNKSAIRCLRYFDILNKKWFQDRFSMHLTRAALMLSDHFYSAKNPEVVSQDATYEAYANSDRKTKKLKQKLDEHNLGVAHHAFLIARSLPNLRENLPPITPNKGFKAQSRDAKFSWQNKAYDLAFSLKKASQDGGFFGVNLASTGCGKTFANARIMYGLSDEKQECRFSIALGLRVLTLQTGDALKKRLNLDSDDIAVLIGSQAFQELYELKNNSTPSKSSPREFTGSESLDDLLDEQDYTHYEGSLAESPLSRWFATAPNLNKMVTAPILVSTIDHLISATESGRGGRQIAPILRLLTSDLVLDEPDDFDVADLPALCRLVNFAGVFGSRVLLSSATLPPAIVKALFEAYKSGRSAFNKACRKIEDASDVPCAWFDEFGVASSGHANSDDFMKSHEEFIQSRILHLDQQKVLRRAALVPITTESTSSPDVTSAVACAIRQSMYQLHSKHFQVHPTTGKRLSVGLVRMANIDPMVAVAKVLFAEESRADYCIHFCLYHSRFPMLIRSKIEEVLDKVLTRHKPELIWDVPEVVAALSKSEASNHIFVVLATSVAEVGRDHDYDWAVVEPSSMRSIIQLAGRVQRHRQIPPSEVNLLILQRNVKGLQNHEVAFHRPGFESANYCLASKDLSAILQSHQFEVITAKPRLIASIQLDHQNNLVDLEHKRLQNALLGGGSSLYAGLWWNSSADWCRELQRRSRFRKSDGEDIEYIAYLEEEGELPVMSVWPEGGSLVPVEDRDFDRVPSFVPGNGNFSWAVEPNIGAEIVNLSEKLEMRLSDASLKFARVSLRKLADGKKWSKDPIFGFYCS